MQNFKTLGVISLLMAILVAVFVFISSRFGLISENLWYLLDVVIVIVFLANAMHLLNK